METKNIENENYKILERNIQDILNSIELKDHRITMEELEKLGKEKNNEKRKFSN